MLTRLAAYSATSNMGDKQQNNIAPQPIFDQGNVPANNQPRRAIELLPFCNREIPASSLM